MVRTLRACAAFLAFCAASFAASFPSDAQGAAPFSTKAPVFTWTGFYVGLNAGGVWTDSHSINPAGNFLLPVNAGVLPFVANPFGGDNGSFAGGLQAGYNWQMNNLLLSVEVDINFSSHSGKKGFVRAGVPPIPFCCGSPPSTITWTGGNSANTFGTARIRLGYAVDRALFYVTAGAAYRAGDSNDSVIFVNAAGGTYANFSNPGSNNNVGYAIGGGIEYALSDNWTVKAEDIYAGFENKNRILVDPLSVNSAGYYFVSKNNRDVNVARIGVSYKF